MNLLPFWRNCKFCSREFAVETKRQLKKVFCCNDCAAKYHSLVQRVKKGNYIEKNKLTENEKFALKRIKKSN